MSRSDASQEAGPEVPGGTGPLADIRVLDLTRLLAGPFATLILGDLGANVIKIEKPDGGDDSRGFGPPYYGRDAAYFMSVNRNKRSVTLDLSRPGGRAVARRLADQCDVVVENFRPGVASRLGLGYEELSLVNPRVIYASISGYGQTGPYRDRPGYDATAQALSGMMSITGEADGQPLRAGVSIADIGAGMWAAIGILAALHERVASGRGQYIDVSLLDGQVSWLSYVAAAYLASGESPRRYGSAHPSIVPYQAFGTADDEIMVAVGNDAMWRRFVTAIGMEDLLTDGRLASNSGRVTHREEVVAVLGRHLAEASADEWLSRLALASVPACRVNKVEEALRHPQVLARDMIIDMPHGSGSSVRTVGPGVRLAAHARTTASAPPLLGEHTREVLAEFGFSGDEIESLQVSGVTGMAAARGPGSSRGPDSSRGPGS